VQVARGGALATRESFAHGVETIAIFHPERRFGQAESPEVQPARINEAIMEVQGIVTTFVATTQAHVQTAIAARLLRLAQQMGTPQQMLELVQHAADTAAQALDVSTAGPAGGFDDYA
jgi:hypothetical protein